MTDSVSSPPDRTRSVSGATRRALAGVVLLISMASCGGASSAASDTTIAAGAAAGSASVPELLQFTAPLVGGGEFNGADRAGRSTAFWFWAPT